MVLTVLPCGFSALEAISSLALTSFLQHRTLAHDLRIAPQIGRTGHRLGQCIQVRQATAVFRLAEHAEFID